MFNPKKFFTFLAKLLAALLPILALALLLSIAAELLARQEPRAAPFTAERFWLLALIGLALFAFALLAAFLLAARFVQHLYGLEPAEARDFVTRSLFGSRSFKPWLRVSGGAVEKGEKHVLTKVGGPGNLIVYNDSAVVLERAGRFTRVIGTGRTALDSFEKVYAVIDLRPKRQVEAVSAMSREGIPITCEADISYQIDGGSDAPTPETPFPLSEEMVFRAAISAWVREAHRPQDERLMDWSGRLAIGATAGTLRTLLARHPLDLLMGLTNLGQANPREPIRSQLEAELRAAAPRLGVRILGVELGDVRVGDEVTQQWVDAWKATWELRVAERQALGQASGALQVENARTVAQLALLQAVTQAFQPMLDHQQEVTSKLVIARLFMILSRAASDPLTRVNLPRESVNTLKLLKDLAL